MYSIFGFSEPYSFFRQFSAFSCDSKPYLPCSQSRYFSELSPRPHDTGMVTLAGTQNLNEFELHCRAVLGLPIPAITQERMGASAVILSPIASKEKPRYEGEADALSEPCTDLRIFGKP